MKLSTSGTLRRLDLEPYISLLPPMRREWEGLRFDSSGLVVNPITGDGDSRLRLLSGAHRQPGATYELTTRTPTVEPLEDRRPDSAVARTAGSETHRTVLTIRRDDGHMLSGNLTDESALWAVDVDIVHGRLPRIDLLGTIDITRVIAAEGAPGWVSRLLGGSGGGRATVDLGVLEGDGGTLLDAEGQANRFRGSAQVSTANRAGEWGTEGSLQISARGLGRPALLFFGRRLEREVTKGVDRFWATANSTIDEWEADARDVIAMIEDAGGPDEFVHRALWDTSFDSDAGRSANRA